MTPSFLSELHGEVLISGDASLHDIAADPTVRAAYPLLADACDQLDAGSHLMSLGESLALIDACSITPHGVHCALSGTSECVAKDSLELHAVLDVGPCWRAYSSLTGVALHALDGIIEFSEGTQGAFVQHVRIPTHSAGGFQRLLRAPSDGPPGVAAISVAATRRTDGDVRLVVGGVTSSRPYRVYTSVEEEAAAGGLDEDTIAGLAERALLDAEAAPESAAKVEAAAALLRRAIEEIDAISD